MSEDRKKLVIIAGPTAVGKTESSISLAKKIGGEIVSADSMQVYRYMDIGSAKIRREEMEGVPHHLIDVLDPREEFNVYVFKKLASEAMEGIYGRGHIPILVGGTGFYIQSVLYDIEFTDNTSDKAFRHYWEERVAREGSQAAFEALKLVDPESCEKIDPHNAKRLIRALEYFHDTGEKISAHNEEQRARTSPYDYDFFVLFREREELYRRIGLRVDLMMQEGLLQETEKLRAMGCERHMTSMQGLGYKQLYAYLEGECSLEEAVDRIKLETRHFAKRQFTWFRREKEVVWVDAEKEKLTDVYQARHQ